MQNTNRPSLENSTAIPYKPIQIVEGGFDVGKGWGKEVHICNNVVLPGDHFPTGYAGKLLVYDKPGSISSMHWHMVKHETFYILSGEFHLKYYKLENADELDQTLRPGMKVIIPPNNPHQIKCLAPGTIIEFSSTDNAWDNFRVGKGDSQKPR